MHNRANIDLFDDYLSGILSAQEITAFEERIASEPKFKAAFESYRETFNELAEAGDYLHLERELNQIHAELYPGKKVFFLRPRVLWTMGAAASIALVIGLTNPFGGGESKSADVDDQEYHELTSAEENMTSVNSDAVFESPRMIRSEDIVLVDSLIDVVIQRPTGTCFMISNKGYFLTSKHLVKNKNKFIAQHRGTGETFEVKTIYRDTLLDFAVLKCHENLASQFGEVPYLFSEDAMSLGDVVFTMGYPKSDIVYTTGDVSSETGFRSDSNYLEISMASNPGFSGAPLITDDGRLAGIITANNSKKQSVTYVLKHQYVFQRIMQLEQRDSLDFGLETAKLRRGTQRTKLINDVRPFIFELHEEDSK